MSGCKYFPYQLLISRVLNTKLPIKQVILIQKVVSIRTEEEAIKNKMKENKIFW